MAQINGDRFLSQASSEIVWTVTFSRKALWWFRFRIWLGLRLFALGARIAGMGIIFDEQANLDIWKAQLGGDIARRLDD